MTASTLNSGYDVKVLCKKLRQSYKARKLEIRLSRYSPCGTGPEGGPRRNMYDIIAGNMMTYGFWWVIGIFEVAVCLAIYFGGNALVFAIW